MESELKYSKPIEKFEGMNVSLIPLRHHILRSGDGTVIQSDQPFVVVSEAQEITLSPILSEAFVDLYNTITSQQVLKLYNLDDSERPPISSNNKTNLACYIKTRDFVNVFIRQLGRMKEDPQLKYLAVDLEKWRYKFDIPAMLITTQIV